jgi:hypothetical protein
MSFTLQQKRSLYLGLSILAIVVLTSLAWAQIAHALSQCFQPF